MVDVTEQERTPEQQAELDASLFVAVTTGTVDDIYAAVLAGANLDIRQKDSFDGVLHKAVVARGPEVAECLLQLGADPNMQNRRKQTPLYLAVNHYTELDPVNMEKAKCLLDYGADPNIPVASGLGKTGQTPLLASIRDNIPPLMMETLLRAGADPTLADASTGVMPLKAVSSAQRSWPLYEGKLTHYLNLPTLPEDRPVRYDDLVVDGKPTALLLNPTTWKQWDRVVQGLQASGVFVPSKGILLTPVGEKLPTPMEVAIFARAFPDVLATLNAQGEQVGFADLKDAGLHADALESRGLKALFRPQNMQGRPASVVMAEYDALPTVVQRQMGRHTLLLNTQRTISTQQQGRG